MDRATIVLVHSKWREAAHIHMGFVSPHEDEHSRRKFAYWLREIRANFPLSDYGVVWC